MEYSQYSSDYINPVTEEQLEPTVKLSDQELLQLAEAWMKESDNFHEALKKIQEVNEKYYLGDQTQKDKIPSHKCDAVENLIFMGIETIVPIMTSNPAQFVVLPAKYTDQSAEMADALQEILKIQYEKRKVREHLEQAARHMILYRFGVIKVFWDEYIDDWNLKSVRPQRLWIPKYGTTVDTVPYIIEKVDMTITEIREYFGDKMANEIKKGMKKTEDGYERAVTVWEIWTNDFVFWKYGSLILKKQPNPYFDFTGRKKGEKDEFGNDVVEDVFYNHFRRPRKPYIILSPFTLGKSIIGETSLVEQGIPLQDIVNTLGRQMVNNAKKMGNATWLIDTEVMEEEVAKNKITNEEGLIIYGSGVANEALLRRDAPPPLPNYIPNTKVQIQNSFDNIFGTHATSRGERDKPETLGGRILLKQADISRIDLMVREIDRAVSEIGNWAAQFIRLLYLSQKTVKIYGENGVKFINFSRDNIEDGMEITVKAGSTLQVDEVSRRNEAVQLFQIGALDPITLYKRLKFPDPEEAAERLWQWQTGQLLPAQQAAARGGTPGAGGATPANLPPTTQSPKAEIAQARKKIAGGGGL
jgi:hypothetical protein